MKRVLNILYVLIAGLLTTPALAQSNSSDIVATSGFSYVSNIDYASYVGSGVVTFNPSNSVAIGGFTIRDGGGIADGDASATELTYIVFDFNFPEFIYAMAIFDAGNNVVAMRYQNPTFPDSLQFSGLNIIAPDDGSANFTIRVMFTTDVTDNARLVATVLEATANPGGSIFASANAGGAATSTNNSDNLIEVTATELEFTTQPSSTAYRGLTLDVPPVVSAIDVNNNTDLDYSGTVTLSNTAGLTMTGNSSGALQGQSTFNNLIFYDRGTTQLVTSNTDGLANATSDAIAVEAAPRKRWDGEALTSNWSDANNWFPNGVPDQYDSVVIDNFYVLENYTITINSSGNQVGYLTIRPGVGKNDTLEIPVTNTADNVLTVVGTAGQPSAKLHNGAILQNNGLGTSGTSVYPFSISNGSFAIYDGGRYQHHTNTAHANLASNLLAATNTRFGIFEFDVPSLAATTYSIALDGISYGSVFIENSAGTTSYDGGTGSGTGTIRGNLEVGMGATFEPVVGTLNIGGDLLVAGDFDPSNSTWVVMNGSIEQNIAGVGTIDINRLELDNTSGTGVVLGSPVELENTSGAELALTDGYLFTSTTNIITVPSLATTSGGSIASFVHGPMYLITASTSPKAAPVGKDTFIRTVIVTPVASTTDSFLIEYFRENPDLQGYDTASRDTILQRVSGVEYWNIQRVSGTADADITLIWTAASGVSPGYENQVRVAYWNGVKWDDKGGNPINGSAGFGSVSTDPETSVFGIFTLGSLTKVNPLPVELLAFTAELNYHDVELRWSTAMEENNRGFAIERSLDGDNWEEIGWKDGHHTSMEVNEYSYLDLNAANLGSDQLYYRLRQVDHNGAIAHSPMISVRMHADRFAVEQAWINMHENKLYFKINSSNDGKVNVMITDISGRTLYNSAVSVATGNNQAGVLLPQLPEGIKLVTITNGTDAYTEKMIFR